MTADFTRPGPVLVVGGANWDMSCRPAGSTVMGTSNPGMVARSAGGVGRNIAHNLAQLGDAVRLLTAVGCDAEGDAMVSACEAAGIDMSLAVRTAGSPTGTYVAVLDTSGDLLIGIAAMEGFEAALGAAAIERVAAEIAGAGVVVAEGNLSEAALVALAAAAAAHGVPLVLDPVSVPKARRILSVTNRGLPVALLAANRDEVIALVGRPAQDGLAGCRDGVHRLGVEALVLTLGAQGAYVSGPGGTERVAAVPGGVVDATGAGDAALAATVWALRGGASLAEAARAGQAAAALTIASPSTVAEGLNPHRITALMGR